MAYARPSKFTSPDSSKGTIGMLSGGRVLDQMSLKGHGHPNLIDFIEAGPILDTYYLLMEYFPWNPLDRFLQED